MKKHISLILLNLFFFSMSNTMANTISVDKLIGQFDEKSDNEFISLDSTILPINKSNMYLQKEPTEQLIKAYQDFKKEYPNIPFTIVSATRNYTYQNGIWQRKWNTVFAKLNNEQKAAEHILRYSSMPGTSRHHWGTDIDITSVSSNYFGKNEQGKILYRWLQNNMPKYGFCQPFNENREKGHQTEEWHWSYKPIAKKYLTEYKNILLHNNQLITNKLDFIGHNKIQLATLIQEYVLEVNPDCY